MHKREEFEKRKEICGKQCRFGEIQLYGAMGIEMFGSPEVVVCHKPKNYDNKAWCERLPCDDPNWLSNENYFK